jgi:NAD-dependent dihydropyrimidine dehydrogenase PreA subunit
MRLATSAVQPVWWLAADARAIVSVEVFVERKVVAPVRVFLKFASASEYRPVAVQRQVAHLVDDQNLGRPVSHTARWAGDIHGKVAALDRKNCAQYHTADRCVECHNQPPRSHFPLSQFTNGGHANLTRLDERSCLTCHSFVDTCAACHVR